MYHDVAVICYVLTALDHHRANLSVMRIGLEFHRAGEHQCQPETNIVFRCMRDAFH